MDDPRMDAWVQEAKQANLLEVASSLGARLKRAGHEHVGPCPACGGDDRFSINTKKNVFNCRGSAGGDVISMVQHCNGGDFIGACEFINGSAPPKGESRPVDPGYARERREERRDREIAREIEDKREKAKAMTDSEIFWERGVEIVGTHAAAYLRRRGLNLSIQQSQNLKFVPNLRYVGFADDETQKTTALGEFPAMIAAMRDVNGDIVAIHRTYLDPERPQKLVPPGDRARNLAKKVFGPAAGTAIWLGPMSNSICLAEGIETALSYAALGLAPPDMTAVAAYSLGNISGSSVGTMPHPHMKGRTVQNGVPDMDRPGIVLPPDVREILLLGDGDSEAITTRMHLATAGRRFRNEGRHVDVRFAPDGMDWNDALLAALRNEGVAA